MKRNIIIHLLGFSSFIVVASALPSAALAHRSGCHNLHTCPSDTKSYVCGDLGYPCDGSTSAKNIALSAINVPLVIEKAFRETFGRAPSEAESSYWKKRFRNDKDGLYKIRRTLLWHATQGSTGPAVAVTRQEQLIKNMNTLFSTVYDGRLPTKSESQYWLARIKDKPTEAVLRGAMSYHKAKNILH